MGAKLLVSEQGREQVQVLDMSADEVWVGRSPECSLCVDDGQVSRKHAIVRRSHDRYLIEDLLSANGTYVNEQRISGVQLLQPDDIVRCGGVVLRLVIDESAPLMAEPFAETVASSVDEAFPIAPPDTTLVDELDRQRAANHALRQHLAELEAAARDAEDGRAEERHILDDARAELKRVQTELAAAEENLFNSRDAIAARERTATRAEAECARMREELERMKHEVAEATRHKDQGWGQANALISESEHLREVIRQQQALLEEQKVQLLVLESRRR